MLTITNVARLLLIIAIAIATFALVAQHVQSVCTGDGNWTPRTCELQFTRGD